MKRKFKKTMSILFVMVMVFGTVTVISSFDFGDIGIKAEATGKFTSGYYTYYVNENDNAVITDVDTAISGDVTIPSSLGGYLVTEIGSYSFENCVNLTSVVINDEIKFINNYVFQNCQCLTSVLIGEGVNEIGRSVFSGCTLLKNIIVDSENQFYSSDEQGVLFNRDKTMLIQYPVGKTGEYEIPAGVNKIGENSFSFAKISSVIIPDSVTIIDDGAFACCSNLFNISIPSSIVRIGIQAFGSSNISSISIPKSVLYISNDAFHQCGLLTNINVDLDNPCYSSDEYGVLFNKNKTKLIQYPVGNKRERYKIPNSVKDLEDHSFFNCPYISNIEFSEQIINVGFCTFSYCRNLSNIKIPKSAISIENAAFVGCTSLEEITIESDTTIIGVDVFEGTEYYGNKDNWENGVLYIGNYLIDSISTEVPNEYRIREGTTAIACRALSECDFTSITIPNSVITIGDDAFEDCDNFAEVVIPDSVKEIRFNAFYSCDSLADIKIGNEVSHIGKDAFYNTTYQKNPDNWENGVLYIGDYLIEGNKKEVSGSYKIKSGTRLIADYALSECYYVTDILIPESIISIGYMALNCGRALKNIAVSSSNAFYSNDDFGVLYNKDKSVLVKYPAGAEYLNYEIPDCVTRVEDSAFLNCQSLKTITIGNNVKGIGEHAFSGCVNLMKMEFPDKIEYIDSYAFSNCDSLVVVVIPESVNNIGYSSFSSCSSLKYVHIPANIIGIDDTMIHDTNAYICSDSYNSYAKTYAEKNGIQFKVCDGHDNEKEPTTSPEETTAPSSTESTTKHTSTTKPATTKPAVVPTTKPVATTKPVSTTKPTTTKPVPTTKPVTKPESTTKPYVEEEIIKKPSTTEVKYGETLILHADFTNIPENAKIEWSVEGEGVTIKPSADGKTCAVTSTSTGDVTVTAKYTDANGVEHISEQEIESNASFWQKIVSFFKNLFGMNRVIEQRIKFN